MSTALQRKRAVNSGRKCPCCGRLARPGDPGFGQRMTIFGKPGYWRKDCIAKLLAAERKVKP